MANHALGIELFLRSSFSDREVVVLELQRTLNAHHVHIDAGSSSFSSPLRLHFVIA